MKLITNTPETPITEVWDWRTDIMVATDGTEQRVSLSEFPKRTLNMIFGLDTEGDVNRFLAVAMLAGGGVDLPFFQAATRLTAGALAGDAALSLNTGRTDLRAGADALLFGPTGAIERVTIATLSAVGCTLAAPLAQSWNRRANIAPIWPMYSTGNLAMTRKNPDFTAEARAAFAELGFMEPFINQYAVFTMEQFNGYPVLPINAVGTEFEQTYATGAEIIEYGAMAEIRNPWLHAQIILPRQFLCQRVLEPNTWNMWRTFANYTRGSANPFYMPTFRNDFERVSNTGNTVTFKGVEFNDEYAPFEPFRQLAFFLEDGGIHYAKVSDCDVVGGNSVVAFTPALPGGAVVAKCSMLLKLRIADDKISCEHHSLHTMLSVNLRTAD